MFEILSSIRWQDIADISIVSFIIYRVILLIRGTRAMQMVAGIAVLIVVYFGARELELMTLYWLLGTFLSSIFIIIIIIFQRDIRRALTQVGRAPSFSKYQEEDHHKTIQEVIKAAFYLSSHRIGALIILECETGIKDYLESGTLLDAEISSELIISIFNPKSPLHDGGVLISNGKVFSAGCVLPLTKNPYISKRLGTRHRAALGISEEIDAVIIVVSEETREVSFVQHGTMTANLDEETLRNKLTAIFTPKEKNITLWKNWLNKS